MPRSALLPPNMPDKKRSRQPTPDKQSKASRTDLEIKQIETRKDKIKQPPLAEDENMYIPPLGSGVIMSGKSGSGKSTLLANLLKDKRFYNGWFDKTFIFSPTANGDDIQKSLDIDKKYVFTDLEEAPDILEVILNTQQSKIDDGKADEVEQYAIIFDDVIGDVKFMNSRAFTRCFYQVRHVNCTTFLCTQHFMRVPRVCRLQANFVFFFQGSQSEVETVVEEFSPPMYTRNEFRQLVHDATKEDYSFLTINMKVGWDKRFRRNLDEIISLPKLYDNNVNETSVTEPPLQNERGPDEQRPEQREQPSFSIGAGADRPSNRPAGTGRNGPP